MPTESIDAFQWRSRVDENAETKSLMAEPLRRLVRAIFEAAGCQPGEAECVARHLVEANLTGHDSHGIVRIPWYFQAMRTGTLLTNREPRIVVDTDTMAILDGQCGFGHVMARHATKLAIDKASKHGIATVGLRNSGHIGRVGDWAEMAAEAGMVSLCFVSTSGAGIIVAPHGGSQRRINANPIAIGIPVPGGSTVLADLSTCTIAHGKIVIAGHEGQTVPENCIIDAEGRPTNDPDVFHGDPPGAILPFAGHKGYALSIVVELLANVLTGGGCARQDAKGFEQSMLIIVLDPTRLQTQDAFAAEAQHLTEFVKSSRTVEPDGEILMPGEPEQRSRTERLGDGIPIDATTWAQIQQTCASLDISPESVDAILGG